MVGPPTELAELLAPERTGERAWAAFVREHSPLILRTAKRLGGDHDAAMDRYVYVLERLQEDGYRRLRTFVPGRCRFTTWLTVVTRRLCYDRDRERYGRVRGEGGERERSREQRDERRRLTELIGENVDFAAIADGSGGNPELRLRQQELHDAVERALGELPAEERLLLRLRFDDDRSAREIAEFIGLSTPFHVYRRLHSVLGRLRESLRRNGIYDGSS